MTEDLILKEDLRQLVFTIADYDHRDLQPMKKPGLFDGAAGLALFYYEMSRFTAKEHYVEQAVYYFEKAYHHVIEVGFGLSHGSSGVMWMLNYLLMENAIDAGAEEYLKTYDELVLARIGELKDNIDPMHGLLSIANYMLFRGTPSAGACLEKIVHVLEEKQFQTINGVTWVCTEDDPEMDLIWHVNLGYAHGVPAILYFIEKMMHAGICVDICRKLYLEGMAYFLSYNIPDGKTYFPNRIERDQVIRNYRMAYCNGDLGVACGLSLIAKDMDDEQLFHTAEGMAVNAAAVAVEEIGRMNDIGLCHGAAGNGYLFLKLYHQHRLPLLEKACLAHYRRLLELRCPGTGIAGLTALDFDKERGHFFRKLNPGFIEGTAGVGLSILSFLNGRSDNAWDKILYLS